MGIPYLSTFLYDYAAVPESGTRVDLKGKRAIGDGKSAMYFTYAKVVENDKKRIKQAQLTKTPFGYDGYREMIRELFLPMQEKCESVIFVFDGVYRRHPRKREDPDRTSSIRFASLNGGKNGLPALFEHLLKNELREMGISVVVAHGEADPMVAELAESQQAFVVAGDSDYHLYKLTQGYVPLRYLNTKQLKGPLYCRQDTFGRMDTDEVALWASLIGYDFISLELIRFRIPS
jgi:hypothetical protein